MRWAVGPAALALAALLAFGGVGCVSTRSLDSDADRMFREGDFAGAAARMRAGAEAQGETGRDALLYRLDLGLALHTGGQYEESTKAFLLADRTADLQDYTSVSAESLSLVTGENARQYKGEDFEKVLINTYLAMNFAATGDLESALVEARRVNHKLGLMIREGQRPYQFSAFARYLSGALYEASGEPNDAYIDYVETQKLRPDFPGLGRDLYRTARLAGLREAVERWEKEYALTADDRREAMRTAPKGGLGEIIVLYENGISPRKEASRQWHAIPIFVPRTNPVREARVRIDGRDVGVTSILHDIEFTAIRNLEDNYAPIIAKRAAGLVVKEVIADQVGRKNELLGAITRVALWASDRADVRSWNWLPRDLQVLRIPVEPGLHEVAVEPVGAAPLPARTVQVEARKKVFLPVRYMP